MSYFAPNVAVIAGARRVNLCGTAVEDVIRNRGNWHGWMAQGCEHGAAALAVSCTSPLSPRPECLVASSAYL